MFGILCFEMMRSCLVHIRLGDDKENIFALMETLPKKRNARGCDTIDEY